MQINLEWGNFKEVVDSRSLSVQYLFVNDIYYLFAFDGPFSVNCFIPLIDSVAIEDFETNYKPVGNKKPKDEVITQFEKNDKILQIFSAERAVQEDGIAIIEIKIPGTIGSGGRWVSGGNCFFDAQHAGDRVMEILIVDKDNIMGYGENVTLGTYHDDAAADENKGWRIPVKRGFVEVEALGYYGFLYAGLYLVVIGKKGAGQTSGTFYVNLDWGKDG